MISMSRRHKKLTLSMAAADEIKTEAFALEVI
ncbi:hypothetical protein GGD56_003197 [Rhizobium mongolense]|uniref:Uncharacterized protein n=1 Tax=Rhizobium mongolense TaxID=57676 RepID=A0ABR6IN76_9HYPH|nr:hypothetical protein [Rhizobium mongolense]